MTYNHTATGDLQYGSKGVDVSKLQTRLKQLGYYDGEIDGSYGPQTRAAVKAYQKQHNLYEDGVVGEKTGKSLENPDFKVSYEGPYKNTGETLRYGNKGQSVQTMQKTLKEKGYYNGKIDGLYGNETRNAVKAYQKDNGLKEDGIFGSETSESLEKISDTKSSPKTTQTSDSAMKSDIPVTPKTTQTSDSAMKSDISVEPSTETKSSSDTSNKGVVNGSNRAFRTEEARNKLRKMLEDNDSDNSNYNAKEERKKARETLRNYGKKR